MDKGLSPIISVILILIMAIFLTVLAIIWLPKFVLKSVPEETFNKSYIRSRACLNIENVDTVGKTLTIRNCGKTPLSDFNFYVDGEKLNLYLEELNPQESIKLNYVKNLTEGNHDFYISSDYAETSIMTFYSPLEKCIYPAFGNWDIYDDMYCYNQLITINGNITIHDGGNLTFGNVTLRMNSTKNRDFGIEVKDGGKMFIYDNDNKKETINDASEITNGPYNTSAHYFFFFNSGSQFEMKNSYLSECGYDASAVGGGWLKYAGLWIATNNSIIKNNTFENNYRAIQLDGSTSYDNVVSYNTIKNSSSVGIGAWWGAENNIISYNNLTDTYSRNMWITHDARNNIITRNNMTDGVYGIIMRAGTAGPAWGNNFTYNIIKSANYGIYITEETRDNLFVNSSITNSGIYDYYLENANSTNNFINMNFTDTKTIYFDDSVSWFSYNNRTDIDLWLKTKVSSSSTLTRELTSWTQDLIKWNDTSDSTVTATYNVSNLETNTVYYVYNNSIFTSSIDSGSNGEISFTIELPINEEHEISVEKSSGNVLWFKFNEGIGTDVYDSSPNGNDGVFYGESFNDGTLADRTCNPGSGDCPDRVSGYPGFGNGLKFNGYNQYVRIPDDTTLDGTDMNQYTLGAWIKLDMFQASYQRIVHKNGAYNMFINSGARKLMCGHYGNWEYVTSVSTLELDKWYYITCVYNQTHLSVYLDGSYDNSILKSDDTPDSADSLIIGLDEDLVSLDFNGTIDEVRIWDRSLTETEIQQEMNNPLPVKRPVASYSFEEDSLSRDVNDTHIWVNGTYNSALNFDGVDDYVEVPDSSYLKPDYITIAAWIYPATDKLLVQSAGMILKKIDYANNEGYYFQWNNNSKSVSLGIGNGASWKFANSDADSVTVGQWTHIAGTYNGTHVSVYVDGEWDDSTSHSGTISNDASSLRIGAESSVYKRFNGTIDEVKIWNRALSQSEIQAEMYKS